MSDSTPERPARRAMEGPAKPRDLTGLPLTDPSAILQQRDGIYATDLLIAGVCWLDVFTWLDAHPCDLPELCRALRIVERPADVMLTLFTALGLVQKIDGAFLVTEVAREHLVSSSPRFLGPYLAALKDRTVCTDLLAVLRTGEPANWCSVAGDRPWERKLDDAAFAGDFTAAMDARAALLAPTLAARVDCRGYTRLLDVAGGSGIYACALLAAHPHLSAVLLERPPVDRVAERLIAERGFAGRVSVATADMFTQPLPTGCDVHLFSNVLHDWDVPQVKRLLAASFASLPRGGMLLVHDAHLDAAKSGPLAVAAYSALLMHSTRGRCYSVAEMERLMAGCGFIDFAHVATVADRSVLTAKKP